MQICFGLTRYFLLGLIRLFSSKLVIFSSRLDKMLKWSTDYFMAAHKSGGHGMFCSCQNCDIFPSEIIYFVPSDCEFVGQIGNGGVDHGFWGRPEEMTMDRFDGEDSDDDGDDGDGGVDDDDGDGDSDDYG